MEDFSKDNIKNYITEFLELYDKKPISNNAGGMKSHHCFWLWYFLKKVQPEVVIESGIWKGQSTWLIEQTCPNAHIISIDPRLEWREYISSRAEYTTVDFNNHNWKELLGNKKTLAFIDDHQDNFKRLEHAFKHGINYMVFEDNYPTNHGDVLSLKKILSNNYHILDQAGIRSRQEIPVWYKPRVLEICEYNECPPVYLDSLKTRWNNTFVEHNCKPPVFDELEDNLEIFKKDQLDYTFIAFVKLLN
jgi:hypothetical protein